jgi:hypothetical protein
MRRSLPFLLLISATALAVENVVPTAFPADRYAAITEKSPFALETPKAPPPPPPQASFAANWFLTAVARNEQGQDFVTVKAQDGSVHFSLTSGETSEGGVSLASVDWSDQFRKSTATIKKGTETAKLIFSQEEAAPVSVPNPAGGRRTGAQGVPPPPVIVNPASSTSRTVGGGPIPPQGSGTGQSRATGFPRPGVVPQLPPVVSGQVPATNGSTPPAGDPSGSRRRIRSIAAPQQ